jgi:hypothetical protein
MSDEQNVETNDGTFTGLKKTIIGTISTAIIAGGTWFTSYFFEGGNNTEENKTEHVSSQPVINLTVDNSSQNNSSGSGTTIIKERVVEKEPAEKKEVKNEKKSETENSPW